MRSDDKHTACSVKGSRPRENSYTITHDMCDPGPNERTEF